MAFSNRSAGRGCHFMDLNKSALEIFSFTFVVPLKEILLHGTTFWLGLRSRHGTFQPIRFISLTSDYITPHSSTSHLYRSQSRTTYLGDSRIHSRKIALILASLALLRTAVCSTSIRCGDGRRSNVRKTRYICRYPLYLLLSSHSRSHIAS